jgi:hypothetical protein
MFYTIVFLDIEGNEIYRKSDDFHDESEALKYASLVVANGRHNEFGYDIHEQIY